VPEAATEKLKRFLLHTEKMKLLVMYKDGLPTPMVWEATGSDMKTYLYPYLAGLSAAVAISATPP
jgi:hypothetical protein